MLINEKLLNQQYLHLLLLYYRSKTYLSRMKNNKKNVRDKKNKKIFFLSFSYENVISSIEVNKNQR